MESKKNNAPGCIKNYVNKININCIDISIFAVPKKPNRQCHHKI
jgi:hypothetical protein